MMKRGILCLLCFFSCLQAKEDVVELKQRVAMGLSFLHGWCSKEKANEFIDLILEIKPDTCVEIGVFGGASLFPVASALQFLSKGIVIGIDPWETGECIKYYNPKENAVDLRWWSHINLEQIYKAYLHLLRRFNLESYCFTMRMTSEQAVSRIHSIDILHIDGNHSEVPSMQDVRLYLPKVKTGGYIWMNDALWEQRKGATDFLSQHCDEVKSIDKGNCILFRKR